MYCSRFPWSATRWERKRDARIAIVLAVNLREKNWAHSDDEQRSETHHNNIEIRLKLSDQKKIAFIIVRICLAHANPFRYHFEWSDFTTNSFLIMFTMLKLMKANAKRYKTKRNKSMLHYVWHAIDVELCTRTPCEQQNSANRLLTKCISKIISNIINRQWFAQNPLARIFRCETFQSLADFNHEAMLTNFMNELTLFFI